MPPWHTRKIQYIEGDHDVFGDGSVVLLSTPGHTPGHQSLYVKLAHTGGVVVSGDLYHYPAEADAGKMPPATEPGHAGVAQENRRLSGPHPFPALDRPRIDWYRDAVKAPGWYD